ncbi:DUF1428 domain-containing protein [Terricaulis sp.]|uniref:DUF1428 domain-containing protein n=1 Tax=Terricaulis sp. TaxID=2768686 RepID=UPI003783F006
MAYADGFLLQVPTKNMAAYKRMSEKAGKVWMEYGALDYKECWGDDMTAEGMTTTFPKALRVKSSQTIVFSWIVYASKAERNRILKLVMADPRLAKMPDPMPFDPTKMLYGGFEVIVDMLPGATKRAPAKKRAAPKKAKKSAAKAKAKRARN